MPQRPMDDRQPSGPRIAQGGLTVARTGLVVTIGPAMRSADQLAEAAEAGARGFRIPLSRQLDHAVVLASLIAEISATSGIPLITFLDVPGPKKILMVPAEGIPAATEVRVPFVQRTGGTTEHFEDLHLLWDIQSGYFEVGDTVLLGDGEAALIVLAVAEDSMLVRPPAGGIGSGQFGTAVSGKEGHRPGAALLDAQTLDIIKQIPDATILLSFVTSSDQVNQTRSLLAGVGRDARVWSKVETRAGIANLPAIIDVSDGVLLGRGDLLIDTGPLDYHAYESRARAHLLANDKPWMLGTQLWTASLTSLLPHRSELSYLCDLVAGGVDFLLLSDETTVGPDPAGTIRTIRTLIERYSVS